MKLQAFPGEHGDCCGNYRESENGHSNGVCIWKKSTEMAVEARGEKMMRSWRRKQAVDLYRADKKHIERIRIVSNQCQLDAGGLRLDLAEGCEERRECEFLSEFVQGRENLGGDENRIGEQALTAIALHADASADRALEGFSSAGQPEGLRKRASFWMGAARGAAGLAQLEKNGQDRSNAAMCGPR